MKKPSPSTTLGSELRRLREKAKLSVLELSKATALPSSFLKKIESGASIPREPVIQRLADCLKAEAAPLVVLRSAAESQRAAGKQEKRAHQAAHLVDELPADPRLQLGDAVSRWRNRKGWSAKDLAVQSGTTANYVYSIERGEVYPDDDRLVRIAKALQLEPSYLLALSNRGRSAKAANTQRRLSLRRGLSLQGASDAR